MPSFDIISEVNKVELKNAVEQSNKEISTRFDFKNSDSRIEQKELELTVYADDNFKMKQVMDCIYTAHVKHLEFLVKNYTSNFIREKQNIQVFLTIRP